MLFQNVPVASQLPTAGVIFNVANTLLILGINMAGEELFVVRHLTRSLGNLKRESCRCAGKHALNLTNNIYTWFMVIIDKVNGII